jgi:NAD(P)-dependent dehydrogenase (short-subunit alcohol dehydrogenase family)
MARAPDSITVALLSCDGGEEVDRLTSDDPAVLQFLAGRDSSEAGTATPSGQETPNLTAAKEERVVTQPPPSDDSVVLVTGGSRGIGAAIVRQCLDDGFAVCFTYAHDVGAAEQLVGDLDAGPRLAAVRADVTSEADTARAFDTAESLGRVTGLVNNAGVTGTISAFAEISLEQTRRVIDVNLYAPIIASRLAVQRWLPDPTGRCIVSISSVAATLGAPSEYIPYAATKAAVETLTVGLAKELGPSVFA